MKSNLNYEGYEYLNELNHNDRGNPHPQYIKWDNIYKFPDCEANKFIKIFTFRKKADYNYSSIFSFKLIKLDHISEYRQNDIVIQIIKNGTNITTKILPMTNYGTVFIKLKAISNYDDSTKVTTVELFYQQITSNDIYGIQPLFKNVYSSYYNEEFELTLEGNIAVLPSGIESVVKDGEGIMFGDVPLSKTSKGIKGQVACDGAYFYICYTQDNWIRTPKDPTW
ncbi:hypothetical protein [Clostridium sp.]|uniref:hypothetical protein n=1 Tax=Clostridium sp. TaxID=1506 RepID=UPI00290F60F3|nr:hypothetical protein [Clostridium sp.]MDU7212471.1 hypothetical protein [Clostridium sp.]